MVNRAGSGDYRPDKSLYLYGVRLKKFEKILSKTKQTVIFITHSIDEAITMGDRIVVMTAGPGRIKTILNVDIPRPRYEIDVRNHSRYQDLRNEIWHLLQAEQKTQMDRESKLE